MSILSYPKRAAKGFKAYLEPQLHLRVPFEAGEYGYDPRWANKDLEPIKPELRTWGPKDYWAYWAADMLAPPLASTVSGVMSLGFTARETIPIVFFGFAICSVVITLTGKIGATYHIPFPVAIRSTFGMYGSFPMICIRSFVAMMWTAILTVQAGSFLRRALEAIWPSLITFPNHLPDSANINSGDLLCFFLYWFVQTFLSLMPIEKLRHLFLIKAIVVPPTFFALFLWGVIVTHGGGPRVTGQMQITSTYMGTAYSALTGLNAIIGLFSSMAVNMPDFGRFSRDGLSGPHQFFALPIIGTLGALCPIFVTSANEYLTGSFDWYMPDILANWVSPGGRAAKFFVSLAFMLATIGNQIAAGSYPFSNDISGFAPKYINIFRGTIFMAVFCVVSTPWNIIKNAAGLLAFLSGYSCLMGPLAGVIVCDYYLIKKRKLNVHDLYKTHGIYYYNGGWNWRSFVSFIIPVACLMPGFAKSIANDLNVGGAWKIYAFAWLFGFSLSLPIHYIICTYISPPTSSLVAEAVYPDSIPEHASSIDGVPSEDIEKTGAIATEKEFGGHSPAPSS